ncbi:MULTISPECIES: hypothetical protein [Streptomyces]|uniref:hypothetical protein n=1 Tax=Streptomyces TaxID=1883 RepID=UPI0025B0CB9F|nr:hypothetical protein [Streptomyces sp. SRF1]MDN3060659.1 hypothetical protein [Streptomyces sp. SRF1]
MNGLEYKPTKLDTDEARQRTREVSSRLLEMINVKGKVTEPGPRIARCDDEPDAKDLYVARHPWSIYDLSEEEVTRGMENLRKGLPEHGWKILKDGKANSKAQDPEILAENTEEKFAANFTALKKTASGDTMIKVTVVSACHRAPAGTDLDSEY